MVLLFVTAALGALNFGIHRAVLDSRHPMVEPMRRWRLVRRVPISLVLEFGVLLAALLAIDHGWAGAGFAYAGYTAINGLSAWLILTNRV